MRPASVLSPAAQTTPEADAGSTVTTTRLIVDTLTRAIVEHRLLPGSKLAEQKLANHFGVSRTLVRQALYQLAQNRLVKLEPARGAFVATPSAEEARQVFEVRRMLELEAVRLFVQQVTPQQILALREHVALEREAITGDDPSGRNSLLAAFHVRMAQLMGQQVLADVLGELLSRCALITLVYQTHQAAIESSQEHAELLDALEARDEARAVLLMDEHLAHVRDSLRLDRAVPSHDLERALQPAASV